MFGIFLFVVLMFCLSWLLGNSTTSHVENNTEDTAVYPEDVFKVIDEHNTTKIDRYLYDPWIDDLLGTNVNTQDRSLHVSNKTILLLPPASFASDIAIFKYVKKCRYQKIKSLCSLLKEYGFISKSQRISGKGATKENLIKYIKNALENQNAKALLTGYLKVIE